MRELRINNRIRAKEVRVVDDTGKLFGVLTLPEALKAAQEQGMDLVEISPSAVPPVCKIIDYGKFKYRQKKKEQESKKHQVVVHLKEVKMRPVTDEHDFQFKMRHIKRFLSEGNKAKITIVFKGREITYTSHGRAMLERIVKELGEEAKIETTPRMDGRSLIMIVAPAHH
ncbi:MAG: translation initiation factor IF-3 [Deltaproteobacteria bacterium]|nr:translation initiation factor IF-3 [Deltaproteobacteria bacterium]